jgi:pimeloyl-ACP methyl ester carboxylesterase
MAVPKLESRELSANGVGFTVLEAGSGPLALCLHGFPDSAHTWRHLLPALADAGFHAVAPFMRGYAPTAIPDDRCYSLGALAADANAIHDALEADEEAVLIGNDWGAEAGFGAAAHSPERWRRFVSLAIPPLTMDAGLFGDFDQLRRFFYIFFFQLPIAEHVVAADGLAFIDRLWEMWSPGYAETEDLARAKECLDEPDNLAAALEYYRASLGSAAEGCTRLYPLRGGGAGSGRAPSSADALPARS